MREFLLTGSIKKTDQRTSKAGSPYSIVLIEDKEGVTEVIVGSKVDIPPEGSFVLCRGSIRSTPRSYQDRIYYSYSFSALTFELLTKKTDEIELPESLQEASFSDSQIPF